SATELAPTPIVPEPPAPKSAADLSIDIASILGQDAYDDPTHAAKRESHEIDLSDVLGGLQSTDGDAEAGSEAKQPANIESVLRSMREEAVHDSSPEPAEQHF